MKKLVYLFVIFAAAWRSEPACASAVWTVSDNIAIQQIPQTGKVWGGGDQFVYSSDGRYVAFVINAPSLPNNLIESTLRVYRVPKLRAFADRATANVLPVFTMRVSVRSTQAFRELAWAPSGDLFFLAHESDRDVLFTWDPRRMRSHHVAGIPVVQYELVNDHTVAVFMEDDSSDRLPIHDDSLVMTGRALSNMFSDNAYQTRDIRPEPIAVIDLRTGAIHRYSAEGSPLFDMTPSPNGRYLAFAQTMNIYWNGRCWKSADLIPHGYQSQGKIAILDRRTGKVLAPTKGPLAFYMLLNASNSGLVSWSRTGDSAITASTFTQADECSVLPVNQQAQAAMYSFSMAHPGLREVANFAVKPHPSYVLPHVLEVRQGYDVLPALYAVGSFGRGRELLDLAPTSHNKVLGTTKLIFWKDRNNMHWDGLLSLPNNYKPGERLPLIVQTHGDRSDHGIFFAEGAGPTGFPGRAALGRGFAVLTVFEWDTRSVLRGDPKQEAARVAEGYRAAISMLDREGIIDSARVGAIGWSRTAFYVEYTLTHSASLFAAAVADDGNDYGYGQYLNYQDATTNIGMTIQYDAMYGGPPWSNWHSWLENTPGFNVDKVRAPVRMESISGGLSAVLWEWEFYAGLRRLGKPVDLIAYMNGSHSLIEPAQRYTSGEGSLDWLDYWINGYRDPAPGKRDQYARWDLMRKNLCDDPAMAPAYSVCHLSKD